MAGPSPMPPPAQPSRLSPRGAVARPGGPKGRPWPGLGGPGLVALAGAKPWPGPSPCVALAWPYRAGPPFRHPTTSQGPRGPCGAACASRLGPGPGLGGAPGPGRPLWWPCGGPRASPGPWWSPGGQGPPWWRWWPKRDRHEVDVKPAGGGPQAGRGAPVGITIPSLWDCRVGRPWRVCLRGDTCPPGHTCLGLAAVWRQGDTPVSEKRQLQAGHTPDPLDTPQ